MTSFSQPHSPAAEPKTAPPDLNLVLKSLERVEQQNPARSRPHEVTRQYRAFRSKNREPIAEVTALLPTERHSRSSTRVGAQREKDGPRCFGAGNRVSKRTEKALILGLIWVDAKTFRIRRIEGVPAKSPSIWIKDSYVTAILGSERNGDIRFHRRHSDSTSLS
jgi:hypothetical protein